LTNETKKITGFEEETKRKERKNSEAKQNETNRKKNVFQTLKNTKLVG
jgi:hypothetical protein